MQGHRNKCLYLACILNVNCIYSCTYVHMGVHTCAYVLIRAHNVRLRDFAFAYLCLYMHVLEIHKEAICMYLSVSICMCLYMTESTCITRLNTVQINSFIASTPASRVVRGPNHGPHVDVEQLAAR